MGDYYLDSKNVQERFTTKVDWDIDYHFVEGCHGTDVLTPNDDVGIPFKVYKNGDVFVEWGGATSANYVLKADGELFEVISRPKRLFSFSTTLSLKEATKIPTAYAEGPCGRDLCVHTPVFSADDQFYACYLESPNFNRHLTDPQKVVVERFFAAVRQTFPQEFASK